MNLYERDDRDNELPGMWESADMTGGETENPDGIFPPRGLVHPCQTAEGCDETNCRGCHVGSPYRSTKTPDTGKLI